jgi:tetratricopeptide (TPR) repeat protein
MGRVAIRLLLCTAISLGLAEGFTTDEWAHLIAQGHAEQRSANYKEAEASFGAALAMANQQPEWQPRARSLSYLARVEQALGKLDDAETLYRQSLALNGDHGAAIDSAAILLNLGRIARIKGHPDQALPPCLQAIAIFRSSLGSHHPYVADALDTLASVQVSLGKDLEAAATYRDSLSIRQSAAQVDPLKLAATLSDFAALQMALGLYKEAEAGYRRALALRVNGLGEAHPEVAETRLGLANLYRSLRQYSKADLLVEGVLPSLEAALGPGHARVANAIQQIATLYEEEGRAEEAEPLLRRALAIYENGFGPGYPQIAVVLTSLAVLEMDRRNYQGAEDLCNQALKIDENALGPDHPETAAILHKLALIDSLEGRFEQSAKLHEQALEIRKRTLGADHPSIARWEIDYAAVLRKIHRGREAGELEARAQQTLASSAEETGENYRVDIRDLQRISSK